MKTLSLYRLSAGTADLFAGNSRKLLLLSEVRSGKDFHQLGGREREDSDGVRRRKPVWRSFFFDELPRVSSAITVTRCEIVRIDRQVLADEMSNNPEIMLTLMKDLSRTVRMLSGHVDNMAFLRADQRIARYLLSIPVEGDNVVRCTQEEIAAAVSVSRVTASRVLNRFVHSGILKTGYGTIHLLDLEQLKQYANQNCC